MLDRYLIIAGGSVVCKCATIHAPPLPMPRCCARITRAGQNFWVGCGVGNHDCSTIRFRCRSLPASSWFLTRENFEGASKEVIGSPDAQEPRWLVNGNCGDENGKEGGMRRGAGHGLGSLLDRGTDHSRRSSMSIQITLAGSVHRVVLCGRG